MEFPKFRVEKWVIGYLGQFFRPYKTKTIRLKSEYAKTVTDFTRDSIIGFKISARIRAERKSNSHQIQKGMNYALRSLLF